MNINEKMHIAAFKYLDIINEMVAWLQLQINDLYPKKIYNLEIPKNLSEKIDIFKELYINVNIIDIKQCDPIQYYGNCLISNADTFDINHSYFESPQEIIIEAQTNDKQFYAETFISLLLHELNHKIEQLKRSKNVEAIKYMYKQQDFEHIIFDENFDWKCEDENIITYLKEIIYLLFIDTEFYAEASTTFADLIVFNGKIDKFKIDSFSTYKYLNDNIDILNNLNIETYYAIFNILKQFLNIFSKYNNVNLFKYRFIKECKQRLQNFYDLINKIYDFYFTLKKDRTNFLNEAKINKKYFLRPSSFNKRTFENAKKRRE